MPTVPRYQPGQVQQRNLPNARYSDAGASPEAFGAGAGRGLAALGQVAGDIYEAEKQRQDTAAVMEAEATLRQQQNDMLFGDQGAFRTKGKDAFGLPDRVLPEFEKRRGEIAAGLRGRQRELFEQRTAAWTTDMQGDLLRYVARESDDYAKATTQAYVEASSQTALNYYNDPRRVDSEIQRAQDAWLAGNPGIPPEAVRLGVDKIESSIRRGIVGRMMTDSAITAGDYYAANKDRFIGEDQAAIERELLPAIQQNKAAGMAEAIISGGTPASAPVDFDAAVEDVLKVEGGYVANDGGKGETNLGINVSANPDVDVKNLTPEKARALYKTRYWDAIDADALPAGVRGSAFDAAVNMGVGWTKDALRKSGGDPAVFNELRRERYEEIAAADPSKRKFLPNWMARVDRFDAPATGEPSLAGWVAEANKIDDPKVRSLTISALRTQWTAYKEARKESEDAVVEGAWTHVLDGGSLANLPPAVMANLPAKERKQIMDYEAERAKGKDIATDWSAYYSAKDMAATAPDAFARVNLYSLRSKLGDTEFKELVKLQADIKGGKGDEATAGYRTVKQVVDGSLQLAGLDPTPKSETERKRVEAFQRKLDQQVSAFKSQNAGKEPTVEQVQKMADGLLIHGELDGSGYISDREVYAFERTGPDDNFVPDELPQAERSRVVEEIKGSRAFKATGAPEPSERQVIETWLYMKQKGML